MWQYLKSTHFVKHISPTSLVCNCQLICVTPSCLFSIDVKLWSVTSDINPRPVQLGHPVTLSCNANQVKIKQMKVTLKSVAGSWSLCFQTASNQIPAIQFLHSAWRRQDKVCLISRFNHKSKTENHQIRLSAKSVLDPRVCELLVEEVESKDLGKWRSAWHCVSKIA